MDRTEYRKKLGNLLSDQALCAENLLTTLKDEREALTNRNAEALKQATDHKNLFILELEKLETERSVLQRQSEQTQASFKDFLGWCDPKHQLEQQWADLLILVEDCKKANETNGAMLKTQEQQVNTVLSILCGIPQDQTVYDASGNKRQDDPGRPLAKA
ncbi:MAG: flagellar protein FlgN [Pseudomonadota bacterium]